MFPSPIIHSGKYFAPDKPLDHVHVKCMQAIVWASASTDAEYVIEAKSSVVHLLKYY